MTSFSLNVEEMIDFYDANPSARRHSAAIKLFAHEEVAIALLVRYLKNRYRHSHVAALSQSCVGHGARLDKWIQVNGSQGVCHYQVEVKSWSFHGYGPRKPPLPASTCHEKLAEPLKNAFEACWDREKNSFGTRLLDKVLYKMRPYTENVRPLACMWAPMHPSWTAVAEPLFEEPAGSNPGDFLSVWFFSVSAYLRKELLNGVRHIELSLPDAHARLNHLHTILGLN